MPDFKHRTQRVGKRKLAPANEARLELKVARLQRPDAEAAAPTAAPGASLKEALLHTRHHSAAARTAALFALRGLLLDSPHARDTLSAHAAAVLAALAERLLDADPGVRAALLPLLSAVFASLPAAATQPHMPVVCVFLASALSQLHVTVRLDAMAAAADVLRVNSAAMQALAPPLLGAAAALLEPRLHALVAPSLLGHVVPPAYGLGKAASAVGAAGVPVPAPTVAARRKLSSIEARLGCAYVLRRVLLHGCDALAGDGAGAGTVAGAVLDCDGAHEAEGKDGGNENQAAARAYQALLAASPGSMRALLSAPLPPLTTPLALPLVASPLMAVAESEGLLPIDSSPASFHAAAPAPAVKVVGQLVQLWLDCGPGEARGLFEANAADAGLEAVALPQRLALVVHCMRLALQRLDVGEGPLLAVTQVKARGLAGVLAFGPAGGVMGGGDEPSDSHLLKALLDWDHRGAAASGVQALPLVVRTLQLHVFALFPVVPDDDDTGGVGYAEANGGGGTKGRGGAPTPGSPLVSAPACHSAVLSLLNLRVAELAAALLPPVAGVQAAQALVAAADAAALAHGQGPAAMGQALAPRPSPNPFASLAPVPSSVLVLADTAAAAARASAAAALAVPAPAITSEWRRYLASAGQVRRALRSYESLVARLVRLLVAQLSALLPHACRGVDGAAAATAAPQLRLLPALLPLLERLLPHAGAAAAGALLRAVDALFRACPPNSRAKALILGLVVRVLDSGALDALEAAARAATPGGTVATSAAVGAGVLAHSWLQAFPRLLWAMGAANASRAPAAVLALLLERARRAHLLSPEHAALRAATRQLAPLLYACAAPGPGAAGVGARAGGACGVLGPFVDYPAPQQLQVLALLFATGAPLTAPLRRALAVVARHPRVSAEVRSRTIEVTVLTELQLGEAAVEGSSSHLPPAAAYSLAFVLSTLLARAVEVSPLLSGPRLLVQAPSDADRGWSTLHAEGASPCLFEGLREPLGAGAEAEEDPGLRGFGASTLQACLVSLRLLAGRFGTAVQDDVEEALATAGAITGKGGCQLDAQARAAVAAALSCVGLAISSRLP